MQTRTRSGDGCNKTTGEPVAAARRAIEIIARSLVTGQRIRLRGFEGYKAGLDTRTDSTGTHAVAATHRGAEVTFHVSTMLPFTPNNRQQLLRKRHIGNDIVTIVFQVRFYSRPVN